MRAPEKNCHTGGKAVRRAVSLVRFVEEISRKTGLLAHFRRNLAVSLYISDYMAEDAVMCEPFSG
jgi:hypothetical protein